MDSTIISKLEIKIIRREVTYCKIKALSNFINELWFKVVINRIALIVFCCCFLLVGSLFGLTVRRVIIIWILKVPQVVYCYFCGSYSMR